MVLHDERYRQVIERLVKARKQAGLSQVNVALRLPPDPRHPDKPRLQSFVSKVETRERRLDVIELADFACVYGISVSFLLGETDEPSGASRSDEASPRTGKRSGTPKRRRPSRPRR